MLTIRNNRQNYKLLLSAHPVFGRIQTTKAELPNPQNPNTYTMIMRKYLQGAVIEDIQQLENDRVLEISVSNKKTKSVTVLRLLLLWKSWGNTPTLSLLTRTREQNHRVYQARWFLAK